jgi:type II secretory pathway pseudopilin PulG
MGLVEVLVAMIILVTGMMALMSAFTMGVAANKKQGEIATRTTIYAVSKMEELMALHFSDTSTNTTVSPVSPTGGTGLSDGGGVVRGAPAQRYVDYLSADGVRVSAATAFYTRQWQIVTNASGGSKTITVVVFSNDTGLAGAPPSTTIASIKANN